MGSWDEGAGDALSCSFGKSFWEFSVPGVLQNSHSGELSGNLIIHGFIPCHEFSCCSPFLVSVSRCHHPPVCVPLLPQRQEQNVPAGAVGTVFSSKSVTAKVSNLAWEPLECPMGRLFQGDFPFICAFSGLRDEKFTVV